MNKDDTMSDVKVITEEENQQEDLEKTLQAYKDRRKYIENSLWQRRESVSNSYQLGYKYLFTLNGAAAVAIVTIITSFKERINGFWTFGAIGCYILGCLLALRAIDYYISWQQNEEERQKADLRTVNYSIFKTRLKLKYPPNLAETELEDKMISQYTELSSEKENNCIKNKKKSRLFMRLSFGAFILGTISAFFPFLPITNNIKPQITFCDSSYPECSRILAAPSITKPN